MLKSGWEEKTILVTGASSDIGLALVTALDILGCKLLLHAHSEAGVQRIERILNSSKTHILIQADLSDTSSISSILDPYLKEAPIDGLVNCVGMRSRRPLKLLKPEHVEEVMRLNFYALLELIRVSVKRGRYREGLSIVQVSSIAAQAGGAAVTAYAASKAAADIAIRSLSKEMHNKSIRLNSVLCGQTDGREYQGLNLQETDPVLERQYLGLNKTSEVSDIILFLLSNASRKISGHFLPADGGFLQ